jgi:hypothetical protein
MRAMTGRAAPWIVATLAGVTTPFLVADVLAGSGWQLPYFLYVVVALGGLLAGGLQARVLRPYLRSVGVWIVASVVGWSLAAGTAALADALQRGQALRGLWGALAYLGIVSSGGVLLGLTTGPVLARVRHPAPSS